MENINEETINGRHAAIKPKDRLNNVYHSDNVPRVRMPLSKIDNNFAYDQVMPLKTVKSVPVVKRKPEAISVNDCEDIDRENKGSNFKTQLWPYGNNVYSVKLILESLGLDVDLENEKLSTPIALFRYLERKGSLSQECLKKYRTCPEITTISLSSSYSCEHLASGLFGMPKYETTKCTQYFYTGFAHLRVLDLTNVNVTDNELRYIIRLQKLQALGLSGTLVTTKGLRYLSRYANFKSNLLCLKLCFSIHLTDDALIYLKEFNALEELDILGSKLSLSAILKIFESGNILRRIRLPKDVENQLHLEQEFYSKMPAFNEGLGSLKEIKEELKCYAKFHDQIYLGLSEIELRSKLSELRLRKQAITKLKNVLGVYSEK
jgi:hypothetical protein